MFFKVITYFSGRSSPAALSRIQDFNYVFDDHCLSDGGVDHYIHSQRTGFGIEASSCHQFPIAVLALKELIKYKRKPK